MGWSTSLTHKAELPSDPMEPLRRWSDLADTCKPMLTGRGRLHHSSVKVAVRLSSNSMVGSRTRAGSSASVRIFFAPLSPHSGSIHAFLRAVRHTGFDGASLPVGIDEDGRERLLFIDGEVPVALGWRPADRPARLRLVADVYGLDRDGRAELPTAMDDAIDGVEAAVRRRVDAGDPNAVEMWNRIGGSERCERWRRWWMDHHDQFAAALL